MSKLSIIIPVYNSEKYLRRCIDSVTKQDPADCQVILIDDGSTDDSFEIMKEEAEKYNYIDIIHQKSGCKYGAKRWFEKGNRRMDIFS